LLVSEGRSDPSACDGDAYPNLAAARREDWVIPDPRDMGPEEFCEVQDLIRDKVGELLRQIAE
jgi:protein-tyrosine-phosphatase